MTGVKPGVVSISINERNIAKGGYIGLVEWIFNINRNQSFITFAIRDMLTKAQSYDQVVQYLAKVPLLAPCFYIIAGPKAGQVEQYFSNYHQLFSSLIALGCDHYSNAHRTRRYKNSWQR